MTFVSTLAKVKWTPEPFQVGLLRSTPHTETGFSVSEIPHFQKGQQIVPAPAWELWYLCQGGSTESG